MASTRFVTGLAHLSYPHVDKPQPNRDPKRDPKFSAAFVFTPELLADQIEKDRLKAIQQAALDAINGRWPGRVEELLESEGFKKGFRRDVKSKGYPEGSIWFTARSSNQPGLVYNYIDPETQKPAKIKPEDVKKVLYPGAIVRGLITVYTFVQEGSQGVTFGLEGLQFVKDAPRMDGRVAAEDAFEADLSSTPADLSDLI